jgi:PKD repeat protein
MRRFLLSAFLVSLVLPAATAHVVNTPPGYTRMVYDDSHDWGWESGCAGDKGHELNSIDVIEKRINGEFLFVVQPLMVKATQGSAEGAPYGTRETLSFQGPRGTVTTTVESTAESHLTYVDGVKPIWLGPRNHGPYGPSDAAYDFQLGWEIGYRYSDLQVQRGDFLRAFTTQALYEDGGSFHKGDYMPGGYYTTGGSYHAGGTTTCSADSTGAGGTPYIADGYTIQHSNWFPPGAQVGDAPEADFGTDPAAPQPSQAVTFQDASTSPTGRAMAAWKWDFGDSSQSTQKEPQHVFTAASTYTIQLTVTDDAGKVSTTSRDLTVAAPNTGGGQQNTPPSVNFRVDGTPTAGTALTFEDTSYDQDGKVTTYFWDFGDGGATATAHSPTHTYTEAGIYQVTHSVTDDAGATSRVGKEVTVTSGSGADGGSSGAPSAGAAAIADFARTPLAPTVLDQVQFHDTSQPGDHPLVAWAWTFGDNTTATGAQATHQYAHPGRYFVTLSVRADGPPVTVRKEVVVQNLAPTASFHAEPAKAGVGQPIRLVDNSTDRDGHIVEWEWYLGGALPSFGREQQATFDSPGTYTLTLTVTDDLGVTGTAQVDVQVTADGVLQAHPLAGTTRGAPDAGILVGIALLGLAATRRR